MNDKNKDNLKNKDDLKSEYELKNSTFRYGGTHSRDRQQGKGPYSPWEVVKMTQKQV